MSPSCSPLASKTRAQQRHHSVSATATLLHQLGVDWKLALKKRKFVAYISRALPICFFCPVTVHTHLYLSPELDKLRTVPWTVVAVAPESAPQLKLQQRQRTGAEENISGACRREIIHGEPQGGAGGEHVDDGAGVRGLGHEERRHAGLLHGLLQDPGDAQAEQEGALPRQPRRRRRHPRPPAATAAEAAAEARQAPDQARRSGQRPPPPGPPRPRRLPDGEEEVPELLPVLYQGLKKNCYH